MNIQNLKLKSPYLYLYNRYVVTLFVFVVWMLFIDDNSEWNQNKLNTTISKRKNEIALYKKEIEKDKKTINHLKNIKNLENFGRETYFLKKENEEIYIIDIKNK